MCIFANHKLVARSGAYPGVHPKQEKGEIPEKFWRYHYVWNKQQFKQQLSEFTEFKQLTEFTEFTERKQQYKEQHKEQLRQLQQQHKEQQ